MIMVATLLLSGLSSARAWGADRLDQLIQDGLAARRAHDDQGAYSLLSEAYNLSHAPRAAAQLGFCEQALGRWLDAETHLTEALRASATEAWVVKNRAPIEQSLATVKTQIARIDIVGEPAGAEVSINGGTVGTLPLAAMVRVPAGETEIELRMPGYTRAVRTLRLEGGRYQKITLRAERAVENRPASANDRTQVSLREAETPLPTGPSSAEPTARSTPAAATPSDRGATVPASGGGSTLQTLGFVGGGAAALLFGFGAYELVSASRTLDQFGSTASDNPAVACGTDLQNYGGTRCAGLYRDWSQARSRGIMGVVAGGLVAATAATLFVVSAARPTSDNHVAMSCTPELRGGGPPALGLDCVGRF